MVTNNFDTGFDDDLKVIFGVSVGFIKTASITPAKFVYGLDEFEEEFEKDLEIFLNSAVVGITSILLTEYGEIQEIEELDGDCVDAIMGDECMFLDQNFCSDGVFERPDEVTKAHLRPLHIKALIEGKLINRVLIDGGATISLLLESMLENLVSGTRIW